MAFSAKKSLPAVVLCAAMMWTVTGCSSPADNEPASETSQTAADASHAVTITDITGNTIQLEKPLEHAAIQLSGSGAPLLTMAALDRDNYTSKFAAMDKGLASN